MDSPRVCPCCGQLVMLKRGKFAVHWPDMVGENWCSSVGRSMADLVPGFEESVDEDVLNFNGPVDR